MIKQEQISVTNIKQKEIFAYNQYVRTHHWASNIEDWLYNLGKFKRSYIFQYILTNINIHKETKILEIGGGMGYLSNALAEYSDNVYLIDINEDEICGLKAAKKIAEILKRPLHTEKADFENIPYETGSFDVIIAKSCLHHSEKVENAFKEIYRVLKKDGIFIFIEPCRGKFIPKKIALRNFYKQVKESRNMNENSFILRQWTLLLKNNNLKLERIEPTYFFQFKNILKLLNNKLQYNKLTDLIFFFLRILEKIYLWYASLLGQPIFLPHPFTLSLFGFEYFEVIAFAKKI